MQQIIEIKLHISTSTIHLYANLTFNPRIELSPYVVDFKLRLVIN